jgi:hypothetical protein
MHTLPVGSNSPSPPVIDYQTYIVPLFEDLCDGPWYNRFCISNGLGLGVRGDDRSVIYSGYDSLPSIIPFVNGDDGRT